MGHAPVGALVGAADTVSVQSDGADVRFAGLIGNLAPLAGLSVSDARDVSVERAVTLAGDLLAPDEARDLPWGEALVL